MEHNGTQTGKETKDYHLSLRMPSQTFVTLKAAAVADDRTVSQFALRAIQRSIAAMVSDGRLAL